MADIDFEKLKAGDPDQWEAAWTDMYGYLAHICKDFETTLGNGVVQEHLQESFCKLHKEFRVGKIKTYTHARRWLRKTVLNSLRDEIDRMKTEKRGGGRLVPLEKFLDAESGPQHDATEDASSAEGEDFSEVDEAFEKGGAPEDDDAPEEELHTFRSDETALEKRILPDESAHLLLLGADLELLLEKIPPQQANILRDDFFEDLSHEDIAEKLGIKIGSVGVLKQRGLNAMLLRTASRDKVLWDTKDSAPSKTRKRHAQKKTN